MGVDWKSMVAVGVLWAQERAGQGVQDRARPRPGVLVAPAGAAGTECVCSSLIAAQVGRPAELGAAAGRATGPG